MTEGIPQEPTQETTDSTPKHMEGVLQLPTPEELQSVFEHFLKGNPYKVIGVPRADSVVIETMEAGERVEYDYATAKYDHTKSDLPDTAKFSASIHKTFYDGDTPVGGECVANYRDGHWEFVP